MPLRALSLLLRCLLLGVVALAMQFLLKREVAQGKQLVPLDAASAHELVDAVDGHAAKPETTCNQPIPTQADERFEAHNPIARAAAEFPIICPGSALPTAV